MRPLFTAAQIYGLMAAPTTSEATSQIYIECAG
jgi:hypothetical protein